MVNKRILYACGVCETSYRDRDGAEKCESQGVPEDFSPGTILGRDEPRGVSPYWLLISRGEILPSHLVEYGALSLNYRGLKDGSVASIVRGIEKIKTYNGRVIDHGSSAEHGLEMFSESQIRKICEGNPAFEPVAQFAKYLKRS